MKTKFSTRQVLSKFFYDFSRQTTIHGLNILGTQNLHFLERILWFSIIMVSFGGIVALTLANWDRYSNNPTVVSLKKDFRNWENPFPAVTGCFVIKTDPEKASKYILDTWGLNETSEKFEYYLSFVEAIANISYDNLITLKQFNNDPTLEGIDFLRLAEKVYPDLSGTLVTFDHLHKSQWTLIMTEMGICFLVNSKFTKMLAINKETAPDDRYLLRCHNLNGICYGRYDTEPLLPIKYYIHSYLDAIHATSEAPLEVREREELEVNFRMQETVASPTLRDLSPSQRGCRFDDEPLTSDMPVFSTSFCYISCRYRLALKLCGCKPFFYTFLEGKKCDLKGLICLANHAKKISLPPAEIGCQCPQPCDIITYLAQVPKSTKWEFGYFETRITFRWGLIPPTTKYHREILFSFDNFVASYGGTVSLFLGLSFIGLIEMVFLLIENAGTSWKNYKNDNNQFKTKINVLVKK